MEKKVKVKFHIPDNHKLHFTTSVWGGINSKGMIEINFLHDRPPLPKYSVDTVDSFGNIINSEINTSGYQVVRTVQTGVVMDIDSAKILLNWLREKIDAWELKTRREMMHADINHNASRGFVCGFITGVTYTANNLDNVLLSEFSYSKFLKGISIYEPVVAQEEITIHEIIDNDKILKLSWPIFIILERDRKIFIASNEDLNIHGVGLNKEEALQDFNRSFIHFWKYYRDIHEDKTIGYAKRLKALFKEIVRDKKYYANS
jgi:hypothetical protein